VGGSSLSDRWSYDRWYLDLSRGADEGLTEHDGRERRGNQGNSATRMKAIDVGRSIEVFARSEVLVGVNERASRRSDHGN
jgi:hypothetical protein